MPKADLGDLQLYYEVHGEGPPVLLVPGLGGVGAYPDWWINKNAALLEEREKVTISNFPAAEIVASRIDAIVAFDRTADLPRIKAPTLVICAKDDFLTPPYFSEELARQIPGAELQLLDKGGHCASEAASEAFNAAVLRFLQQYR